MRKFAAALLAVALVVTAILVYAAFNLNAFLHGQRDWIAARAGEALQRDVRFEDVGVAWRGGLAANLSGLRVAEDPRFGSGAFLEVDDVRLVVDLWAALRGEYRVTRVVLDRPRVVVVRTARGLNVESLGGGKQASAAETAAESGEDAMPLPLVISLLEVHAGDVRYIDRTETPAREIALADLGVELSDIGWFEPIAVAAEARVFAERQADLRIQGTVGPLGDAGSGAVPLALEVALGPLVPDALRRHPAMTGVLPDELSSPGPIDVTATVTGTAEAPRIALRLDGTEAPLRYAESFDKPAGVALRFDGEMNQKGDALEVQRGELRLGEAMLHLAGSVRTAPQLKFDLRLTGDAVPLGGWERMVPALVPYRLAGRASPNLTIRGAGTPQVAGKVGLDSVGVTHEGLRIAELGGALDVQGERLSLPKTRFRLNDAPVELGLKYDLGQEAFAVVADVAGLVLEPLLEYWAPTAARWLGGTLDAQVAIEGRGTAWDAVRSSLSGTGGARLREGRLRDLNLADAVLQAVTGVAGLTALLSPELRAKHAELLGTHDTTFQDVVGNLRIESGRVLVDDLQLVARDQRIVGKGWFSLAGEVDFQADMALSSALTNDLVARVAQVRGMVRDDGRLTIPFRLAGAVPGARPVPDMDYVMRTAGRAAIESGLDKLFRKPAGEGVEDIGEGAEEPTPRAEEELLRRGLDRLFGR